jgi:hypothetical protein
MTTNRPLSACRCWPPAPALALPCAAFAQTSVYGPYNADLPRGGDGLAKPPGRGRPRFRRAGRGRCRAGSRPPTVPAGRASWPGWAIRPAGGRFLTQGGAPAVWTGAAA